MNFANNAMAVAAPVVTGAMVQATGSFNGAFLVAGGIPVIGIIPFVMVPGRLTPIPAPTPWTDPSHLNPIRKQRWPPHPKPGRQDSRPISI